MKSCVTISMVREAMGGPFVLWDELTESCRHAAELGFDAVEVFAPGPEAIPRATFEQTLNTLELRLAAVGTGAGWVKHGLTLTAAREDQREAALIFIESMIDLGASFGAPAIIGSMQGRFDREVDDATATEYLRTALTHLGNYAKQRDVKLIYEPLNRYETNLCNTLEQGVQLMQSLETDNVVLLADLFHMNIEEVDIAAALKAAGSHVGHVHFVDSNRQPVGAGHMVFGPIMEALTAINYAGYLSAEAIPIPDPISAARQTIEAFRRLTGSQA